MHHTTHAANSTPGAAPATIPALLAAGARRYGQIPALVAAGAEAERCWSYADVWRDAGRAASHLHGLGIGHGDRVVLWAANHPHWVIAFAGLVRLGAVAVPLDANGDPAFVDAVAARVGARLALVDEAGAARWPAPTTPTLCLSTLAGRLAATPDPSDLPPVTPDDLAAILFTSGSTGHPKGVMLTHRNLVSNALTVAALLPPRSGDRALSLLPLSHALELTVGTLLPLSGGAAIVYPHARVASDILACMARYRITGLIVVPLILRHFYDSLAREASGRVGERAWRLLQATAARLPLPARRLLFSPIHRRLGSRLRLLVSGGAPLDPALAAAWERLGVPVVVGYGLTEGGPVVAGSGIADRRPGSVGRCLPGQRLRLSPEGEILIAGPNVMPGYWDDPAATDAVVVDGWLRTGDLGRLDADGYLYLTGRLRDRIVLTSGLNVDAGDVEAALLAQAGVRAAAVLERRDAGGAPQVFAVVAGPSDDEVAAAVRAANAQLLPHQRARAWARWPEVDLPRTASLKVKKHEIAAWLDARPADAGPAADAMLDRVLVRLVALATGQPAATVRADSRLADLGLDSLGRAELATGLAAELGVAVEELAIEPEMSVAGLAALVDAALPAATGPSLPGWPRAGWSRALRAALQAGLLPLARAALRLEVRGGERLADLDGPVVLAPNHASHLDTLAVLAALPARLRRRVAVAAAADYFFARPALGAAVALVIGAFPFDRSTTAGASLAACRELLADGWSLLLFPEGTRSPDGVIASFRPGVGRLARDTGLPVTPIHIAGTHGMLPKGARWPRPGRVIVTVGPPIRVDEDVTVVEATRRIELAVRALAQSEAERPRRAVETGRPSGRKAAEDAR